MRCTDISELMHGYLDRELDLVRSLEVEEHLQECRACSQVFQDYQGLHSALTSSNLFVEAPARLRKAVHSAVRETSQTQALRAQWAMRWFRVLIPVAVTALVVLLALVFMRPSLDKGDPITRQIVAAQMQSIKNDHLTDVASADQYVVQSWFYKKLDFGVPAVDLANHEFPLLGGRIEQIDNHPVAVLVYHFQKHPVGLFVWPLKGAQSIPEKKLQYENQNLIRWTQSGLYCWAVSDISQADLKKFVRLVQQLGYTSQSVPKGEGVGIYKYPQL